MKAAIEAMMNKEMGVLKPVTSRKLTLLFISSSVVNVIVGVMLLNEVALLGFQFCVSVHHIMITKNTSLMQLISICFTYSKSLHVSGRTLPIIRRI